MSAPHYKAFISYSHRDERWARWLQRALESYRVPKRLVGTVGPFGPIPGRLTPVFRDREDLSSAADLTSQIKEELEASETLIVVCSPAAVASPWVNEEVRRFRELGREDRILALVVEGDPLAEDPANSCFPPALLKKEGPGRHEPLAADVRKYADGKRLARQKIIAGLLGVRLDELRRREAHRRNRHRLTYSLTALLLISLFGWLTWSTVTTRERAQAQRANTEELLDYMLGDLKSLEPVKGVELAAEDQEFEQLLREQLGLAGMSNEQLFDTGMEWREAGLQQDARGNAEAAMDYFLQSRSAFEELFRREGGTGRALFELGQAEFYVGLVHFNQGELGAVERSWVRYGVITRRLLNAEPRNAQYVMELSYTLMNLGALEQSRAHPDSSKSLQLIQSAVQYNQMALVLQPENLSYRIELGKNLAWLADAWMDVCDLGNAFKYRNQAVELRRELQSEFPEEGENQRQLAFALSGLAGIQLQMGLNQAAVTSLEESVMLLEELYQVEPDNTDMEWEVIFRSGRLARQLMWLGDLDAAASLFDSISARLAEFASPDAGMDYQTRVEATRLRLDEARLLVFQGETEQARELLESVIGEFTALVQEKPGYRESMDGLARASLDYWQEFGAAPAGEAALLLSDYLADPEDVQSCQDIGLAARLAVQNGEMELARRYTENVLTKGYFETEFVSFCRKFDLCN